MNNPKKTNKELPDTFEATPNLLKTNKRLEIGVGERKIIMDSNSGLAARFLVRGGTSTTYSAETVIDIQKSGFQSFRTQTSNANLRATSAGSQGQELYLKITNDSDANRTITFGEHFAVTGSLTGSTAASAILHFISDGTKLWEVSRVTGLT